MQPIVLLVLTALIANSSGCDFLMYGTGPHPRNPHYAFGFSNATVADINDVCVDWVESERAWHDSAGIIAPGSNKRNNGEPDPIPQKGTISWKTVDGKVHRQEVLIASQIPHIARFSGDIWFKITDAGVQVIPMTLAQEEEMTHPFP